MKDNLIPIWVEWSTWEKIAENIPVGFTFNWSERKEINDFFTEIEKQGFKVVKNVT